MANHETDDDLDALLDEAINVVDEQERSHEESMKQREAQLESDLQKALEESSGAGAGDGADLMNMFQSLMNAGANGEVDESMLDNLKSDVGKLLATLENAEDLGEADKANLARVKDLMAVMDSDDEVKAKEMLEQLQNERREGGSAESATAEGEGNDAAELDSAMRRCVEALQQVSSLSQSEREGSGAAPPAAGGDESREAGVPDDIANMLLDALLDPQFVEPIRIMRDAYDPWLADHKDGINEADKERYGKQHAKTVEICAFLANGPVSRDDEQRVARLLELMHEFSELGEPPSDLSQYAPKA